MPGIYELFAFLALMSALMLAGLMTFLSSVMRRMWREQDDAAAAASFKSLLAYAATNRILSTLSVTPIVAAIAMAFMPEPAGARVGYAYAGGGIFLIGFFLWTAFFNLPIYKAVKAWTLAETPPDARAQIVRFHRANAVRLAASLAAALLFFLAA